MTEGLAERLARLDPADARRVRQTIACRDTDPLAKVNDAGAIVERDGRRLQVMHNGVVVEEGCYYGPWMTEIITELRGHHEPQEEVVFDAIVRRLAEQPRPVADPPLIVELGSFWAYYTIWFCAALPGARGIGLEPDPVYLDIGRRNAALNGFTERISFTEGAVGDHPGEDVEFPAESTGQPVRVRQFDLESLLSQEGRSRVDVLMVDIQGFESVLLPRARDLLTSGAIRFVVVSTHHQMISGSPLTHQQTRELLVECGAHVIAEHTVRESVSGDGLVAVSFDPRDADFTVAVSHARAVDTFWGEPEVELAELSRVVAERDATLVHYQRHIDRVEAELATARAELEASRAAPAAPPGEVDDAPGLTGRLAQRLRRR